MTSCRKITNDISAKRQQGGLTGIVWYDIKEEEESEGKYN